MRNRILSTELLPDQAALFYLGQEGFLIKWRNTFFLIDAYLSDYVDRNESTDRLQWIRRYAPPLPPSDLDFVDYILCSHPHADHADPDTLRAINTVNKKAVYLIPHALKDTLSMIGIPTERICCMDGDETVEFGPVSFTAIPSAHETLQKDEQGHYTALGYILRLGTLSLYHAGDCCIYDGLSDRLTNIDLGLLPINGRDFYRTSSGIIGNMDSSEAIHLAEECGFRMLIPMHFDLYDVNEVNPAYFVDCLYKINPKQNFHIFLPGERYIYSN